jgi:hypothetical protein
VRRSISARLSEMVLGEAIVLCVRERIVRRFGSFFWKGREELCEAKPFRAGRGKDEKSSKK